MIARVIPLKRLPRRLSFFDYLLPSDSAILPEVGQLVQIPFRNSTEFGIIFELVDEKSQPDGHLKALDSIFCELPLVSKAYVDFVRDTAEYYGVSSATLLKMGMMPLQKRKLKKAAWTPIIDRPSDRSSIKNAIQYENEEEHAKLIVENSKDATLILVPEVYEAELILSFLPYELREKAVIWHSRLSTKEQYESWFKIRNGEKTLIIGTRAAILLPIPALDTIIIDYEQDENHKQFDQAPRFHVKDLAEDLAARHRASLVYMSYALSVESYYQIQKKSLPYGGKKLKETKLLFKKKPDTALLFEKTAEPGSKYFTAIHPELQRKILDCVDRKEDIFILVNRKAQEQNSKPQFAIHTQIIELGVKKILHETPYSLLRIEKGLTPEKNQAGPCAIVGTEAAFPYIHWERTGLIVYMGADRQLALAEMNAAEHVWNQNSKILYYKRKDAKFVLETKKPDHWLFRSIGEPDRFYRTELHNRQKLGYPPYRYIVRYFGSAPDFENLKRHAKMLHENIQQILTESSAGVTLTNLFELNSEMRSAARCIGFAIKFQNRDKELIKKINSLLPDTWKIDPHPISLTNI